MQKLEKTELRKADRTVGVNCNKLSRNESTIHSSCMNFDAMKYPSVEHRLLMRKVGFSTRLKVS